MILFTDFLLHIFKNLNFIIPLNSIPSRFGWPSYMLCRLIFVEVSYRIFPFNAINTLSLETTYIIHLRYFFTIFLYLFYHINFLVVAKFYKKI